MDRISGAGYGVVGGLRIWLDRNLSTNTNGTFGNAAFFNGVQESILAPVDAVGLTPTDADDSQLLQAIIKISSTGMHAFNTAGAFSFTMPVGWNDANVLLVGGGGAGGNGNGGAGAGGSSGGIAFANFTAAPGTVITGFIGAGGAPGSSGGSSSFGTIAAATGGAVGSPGNPGGSANPGFAGSGTEGILAMPGTQGGIGGAADTLWLAGRGGGGPFGGGGQGASGDSGGGYVGVPGVSPGAGGGGGTAANNGGSGAAGLVLIWR